MSKKGISVDTCLGLLQKLQETVLPHNKILEGANNFQTPANISAVIDGVNNSEKYFRFIESYVGQDILKPWNDRQDKFITFILTFRGDTFDVLNFLIALSALAYEKGDIACLEEIADQYQDQVGVGHLMNNLGVMFSERMDYKRSETCFARAKKCFEHEHDHLANAVATLNLAILHKFLGNYQNAQSCCDDAVPLCHDISRRTTRDVHLPWKVLRRVAGLFQEFGNYKRCQDILRIGVLYDISGADEASADHLMKWLMTLQLKELNGEKIQVEELEGITTKLFELLDQTCPDNQVKRELLNADFVTTAIILAKMYRDINHLEEACLLLEKLEAKYLLVHSRTHVLYGLLLYQIGSFKLSAGKVSEAENTLKQAQEIFLHYFGNGHYMVASCKSLMGTCALLNGHTGEALTYLNEALTLWKKMNHCHPEVAEILFKFAFLYSKEENFESAKTTVQEALDIFISVCGEVSPKTAGAFVQAAVILQKSREFRASAGDKAKKAIDIFLKLGLRHDHPDVMICCTLLGQLQLSLGQVEQAEEQFTDVQQHVTLQDEPCMAAKIISLENTNMFFQMMTDDGGTGRYSCFLAKVVSLVNLVNMKVGRERKDHLHAVLSYLQGNETEVPLIWDFAGQNVSYMTHRLWMSDRYVHCILISASPPVIQTDQNANSDYAKWKSDSKDPDVFFLHASSSNDLGKQTQQNPCSVVFWKIPEVLEMSELSRVGSAFRESINMLFLQPKFRKSYIDGQDFYMELTLPKDPCAMPSLCSQIDWLPLLVEQELSDTHEEHGNLDCVVHTSLASAVKPSTHVSYFAYRFSCERQAELVFDSFIFSLSQTLTPTKVEGVEISNASAVQNGVFVFFLEPNNSSLSLVVEKESVLVKCRTVNKFQSTVNCICLSVKGTLERTMDSLCRVVRMTFRQSFQLLCDDVSNNYIKESTNCSCGCKDFQSKSSSSGHSLETVDLLEHVGSQEAESDHQKGKPRADVLQNEHEEDVIFAGRPGGQISTEVCLSLLECLLSNRHLSTEVQPSGTDEISSSDAVCVDDSMQLKNSLLSRCSMSSLNSLPTSPSNYAFETPDFLQNLSPSLTKVTAEPCDEKSNSNNNQLSENPSAACVNCSKLPLNLQNEELSNSPMGDNLLQDCPESRSSYEGLPSGESSHVTDTREDTRETVQLEDGTRLSVEEILILKSEVAFSQNQCHELRQNISHLKEQLHQCEAEKQQLELELGRKSFLEDKQKRSERAFQSSRAHVSEQSESSRASGASYAGTEGKLLGGAGPLPEPRFSLQERLLEISNSLSHVELKQMKSLVRPKVNGFRLAKIREGFELFEELDTRGQLSCTYIRELLEGIRRFDLLEKLDVPVLDNAESGSHPPTGQRMLDRIAELPVIPSRDNSLDLPLVRSDDGRDEHNSYSMENPSQSSTQDNFLQLQSRSEEGLTTAEGDPDAETEETDPLEDQQLIQQCTSENSDGVDSVFESDNPESDSEHYRAFLTPKSDEEVVRLIVTATQRETQEQINRLEKELKKYEAENEILQAELAREPFQEDKQLRSENDSSSGGSLSNESTSAVASSSELSAYSAINVQSSRTKSISSSCNSHSVCTGSSRVSLDHPLAVKNRESSGDSSYNPTSSGEEILESSLLSSDDDDCESRDVDMTEAEVSESSSNFCDGPVKQRHLEITCATGVGEDVVDCGPVPSSARIRSSSNLHHVPGLMQDALPDGDMPAKKNLSGASSGNGKDSLVDKSVSDIRTQSNQWVRLGARPRDRPPMKMAPPEPSLVDLVPQEVAEPVVHGLAGAFLARHSEDRSLIHVHESLNERVAEKVLSQGASFVDGLPNSSEASKAKPYFGDCQVALRPDVHSRLQFPFPPVPGGEHDSCNAVGGYAYNTMFNGHAGLLPGPPVSYSAGSNFLVDGNFPSSSVFDSSNFNSFRCDFALGTSRPTGMGQFDRDPYLPVNGQIDSGLITSNLTNDSIMGAAEAQLTPRVYGTQRSSGFNDNTSTVVSERKKTQTTWTAKSGLSTSTVNMTRVDVGSSGLPAPYTDAMSNGADNRHLSEAESSRTGRYTPGTGRSNVLNTSSDRVAASDNRHNEAALPSGDPRVPRLVAGANTDPNLEPRSAEASFLSANTGGSMLNRDFGTDSVESTDNSLLALEQRVEEACALVERVLREREEREQFGREIERKEREIREERARKRREREARELEEASRWPQEQEAITGRSQWLCEHYQRHCRVRFPCCSHFYSCHRCHNNSKACDNEEAKASHATHLKCSFCHHEQEIGEDSGKCRNCGAQMSAYFCSICKHFTSVDKNPYHCKKCGICRIHKDKSFHCEVCNVCLDKRLEGKHKCRPDSGHDECCICLEDAFSGCQILPCSHKVHRECAIAMIQNGIRTCPVCRHPLYSPASE